MRAAAVATFAIVAAACGATIAVQTAPPPSAPGPRPAPPTTPSSKKPDAPTPPPMPSPLPKAPEPAPTPVPPKLGAPPSVRVLLTKPFAAGTARVVVKGAWTLVSVDGATIASGRGLDGALALGASPSIAGTTLPFDAELRPAVEGDLKIDARTYAGALRVERAAEGKAKPFIATDIETYVSQVVNSEIPAAFPREAQRTQACLARSYALAGTARTSPEAPLYVADVGGIDQEFAGLAVMAEHRRIGADAASSTRGLVLLDGGAPLLAYYHSTCGGTTCPGEVVFGALGAAPPLKGGIACPWCAGTKYFTWDARLDGASVAKAAGLSGQLESFVVAERTSGGRATSFDVKCGGKTKRVRAPDFRLKVGASALRSTLLDFAVVDGGGLVVKGRGWGHGVGLCQMGAKALAEKGMTAEAILAVYYPGAALEKRW